MNNEISRHYFSDRQFASILGISIGGLRNKIYRGEVKGLPPYSTMRRKRLWGKSDVRTYLLQCFNGNLVIVDQILEKAEYLKEGKEKAPQGF